MATKKLLKIVKTENEGECATFHLDNEDHTLGNALRYMIMKNPNVKFCGYSMPHPNERQVIMQIQMYPGRGYAIDALENGIKNLMELSMHIKSKFSEQYTSFTSDSQMDSSS